MPCLLTLCTAIDKLTCEHAFRCNEEFFVQFVFVGVLEDNSGKRSTTSGIMNDVLYDTFNVSVSFSIVKASVASRAFPVFRVGSEDASGTFSLRTNNATHLSVD